MKVEELKLLQIGASLAGTYVLINPGLKVTRAGTHFLTCMLQDNSGKIPAVQWEVSDAPLYEHYFQQYEVYTVKGRLDNYKDSLQVVILELSPVEEVSSRLLSSLLPSLPNNEVNEYINQIKKMGESLKDTSCLKLFRKIFEDPDFVKAFSYAPAAVMVHHAYCGGLAQHTAYVMHNAWFLFKTYQKVHPALNSDVILLGALFHDLGKIEEISTGVRFASTSKGKLLGHTMISLEIFSRLSDTIEGFPSSLKTAVKHCIISHHGLLEWGAAVVPKTLEAEIVFLADYTDSNVRQFVESLQQVSNDGWSEYNRFLERSVFSSAYGKLQSGGQLWEPESKKKKNSPKMSSKKDNDKDSSVFKKNALF